MPHNATKIRLLLFPYSSTIVYVSNKQQLCIYKRCNHSTRKFTIRMFQWLQQGLHTLLKLQCEATKVDLIFTKQIHARVTSSERHTRNLLIYHANANRMYEHTKAATVLFTRCLSWCKEERYRSTHLHETRLKQARTSTFTPSYSDIIIMKRSAYAINTWTISKQKDRPRFKHIFFLTTTAAANPTPTWTFRSHNTVLRTVLTSLLSNRSSAWFVTPT